MALGLVPQRMRFIPRNHSKLAALLPTAQLTATAAPPDVRRRGGLQERFYFPELDAIRFFLFWGVWGYHALPREEHVYTEHHVPAAVASLIASILKAGMANDVAVGIPTSSAEDALAYAERGFTMMAVGSDTWWLNECAGREANRLREAGHLVRRS